MSSGPKNLILPFTYRIILFLFCKYEVPISFARLGRLRSKTTKFYLENEVGVSPVTTTRRPI